MSEVKVNIDLDLDTKKAKEQLEDFKDLARKEDIKVKLDLDNSKDDVLRMKNLVSNAFKLDDKSMGDLGQVENSIKEINRLLSSQDAKKLSYDIKESDLNNMKEYVRLSQLISRESKSNGNENSNSGSLNRLERTSNKLEDIQNRLNRIQNARGFLDETLLERTNSLLSETRDKLDADGMQSDFKQVNQTIRELTNNLQDLTAGNTLSRQEAGFNTSLESMRNRLESFKDSIQGLRGSDDIIERLESSFRSIDSTNIERATVDLRQFGNELNQAQREARQLEASMGRSFFGNFGQEFRDNLFTFTAGELLADSIRNMAYSLKTLVMEYDTAMTNLKKVANPEDIMNVGQLDNIEKKAVQIAKNVGQSSQDTIQAISDTIQMAGLGMEESILVAEQTMKLANVAEMSQQLASESVVAMLSSFDLNPLREMPIVVDGVTKSTNEMVNAFDMVNYVGNQFAVSSAGIMDAITSGANVLATYNVSLEDTIAMITASNASLQDTSRVGNGLKTIAVNLAGIKASADTGELSLNKTAKTLKEVAKIDVFADKKTNQLKSMSTIIEELAAKWKDFDDVQRAGISEAVGGKQQAAVFSSLIQNYDKMKDVQDELSKGNHFESMEKENAQYIDSLSGQLNKLKETWVGIFNTIFNSDSAKSIIKGLVAISEAIAMVVTKLDEVGLLTPMLAMLGVTLGSKVLKGFTGLRGALTGTSSAATSAMNVIPRLSEGLGSFGLMGTRAGVSLLGFGEATGLASLSLASFMPHVLLATSVIGGLAVAYDYFNESLSEEKQRLEESISARKDEVKGLEEQKKSLGTIAEEYDKLKDKPKKTSKELERLTELTNELAKIKPELLVGYDENGNAIINMTDDVSDLIKELDSAIDRKSKLLKHEEGDLAENSVKQLYGKNYSDNGSIASEYSYNKSEMGKLEDITEEHVENISKLEKKRDKLIGQLYGKTGDERLKIAKKIDDINYEIEKSQSDFNQEYTSQLDVIKEYTDKVGEGLFSSIENGSTFKSATEEKKKHFLELKDSLDFSDIKTEEDLFNVEKSLNKFLRIANEGKIDIKGLENSIKGINDEFGKTGDLEEYNSSMNKLAKEISDVTGIDVNTLSNLFTQFDTSVLNGKDSLDKFLNAYGKTKDDLMNDNSFAKALANQKRSIDDWVNSLNEIGYDKEIDLEIAYNLVADNNLPEQVRDMVRTLLNKGNDPTEVLDVAQKILIDLSDGEVDLESVQFLLDRTFGEGAFEVDSKILLNPEAEISGIEDVVNRLKEKYGEIPTEIETAIRVDSITSYMEAERVLSLYNNFPDEVKTSISTNGYDTLKDLELIQSLFLNLPEEQAMTIITNYSDIVKDSENLEGVLDRLSRTPINIETKVTTESAEETLNNITKQPIKDVIVGIKGDNTDANRKAEESKDKIDEVKQDTIPKIQVDNISANNRLKTTKQHLDDLKSKEVTVTVKTNYKSSGVPQSNNFVPEGQSLSTYNVEPMPMAMPSVQRAITPSNEIELLSASRVRETVANTSVEQLNVRARAKNPIGTLDSVNYSVNAFQKLESQLKKISNELSIISEKAESAFGTQKIGYLKQQIQLYEKQQDIQHQLAEGMRQQANDLKGYLQKKGVQISSDGQVLNYSQKMLAIEKEIKALRDADTGKKDSNKNSSKIEELEKLKKSLEEYINLTTNEIPNASATWWDLENAIKKARSEAVKTELAMKNINASIDVGKYSASLNAIRREINRLDEDIERAFGEEKEELLKKKIDLIKKEQDELHKLAESYRSQAKTYKDFLSGEGFKFDNKGDITNLENIKSQMNADEFEAIKDVLEDYIKLTQNTIPDLSEDWWDLQDAIDDANQAIKDSQREQLETTKKVQDQIMEMYKKQAEEKKKLIDKELKQKIDALNKEQKAYNDARKQQKYEDSYDDQLKKVMELENQLALLAKDDTLGGKKKYQDLLKELQEEQKKLEDIVQDKIDDDVNNFYDDESDRLQEEADKIKEEIDNAYSDEKLQEMVNNALSSGKFEDINGQLIDLNKAMLDYVDKYEDGMSAVGAIIKDEWLTNLDIAKDTMKDMASILENLDLDKLYGSAKSFTMPTSRATIPQMSSFVGNVDFSSPLIVVEGNVDRDVMGDLKDFGIKLKDDIINTIYRYSK